MVWTSLVDVLEDMSMGKTNLFPPTLVFAGNYVAQNKFLAKFGYASCPARLDIGRLCEKSHEWTWMCSRFS